MRELSTSARRHRPGQSLQITVMAACLLALLVSLSTLGTAQAQRSTDGRDRAGVFDYYTLVLSWSPTYCETEGDRRNSEQCRPRRDRPYAFVLHGLWPQHERGYPERCDIGRRPFVPERVIRDMLDIMPARGLVIHQYRKHGTCSGLDPSRYFSVSRQLFQTINIPDRFVAPRVAQFVSPDDVVDAFISANKALREDMIAVSCSRRRNAQLREVRICFTPDGRPRTCGSNENRRRLCRADRLYVPPVRFSR